MAKPEDVEAAWAVLESLDLADGMIPITYMNSAASIKAFCGEHGGIVCTSSNAKRVFDWAFERGERLMFFPDEHLGRNTAVRKGIPMDKMVVWDPMLPMGGNSADDLRNATVILWKGFCSVHARFNTDQIAKARADYPDVNVIVHPECRHEVVAAADFDGSTEYIIDTITAAPAGTTWAVGTEINLVRRLQNRMPDKRIYCLDPIICPCSTMYRIHTAYILWALQNLERGEIVNEIKVEGATRENALIALDRMLALP
jgi:quinolinate synthase